jgi:anti-sigma factor RsiW
MNCAELRRYLSAFLDSELDGGTTAEVGAHLDACPACAERVEGETRLERAIAQRLNAEPVRECFWEECRDQMGRPRVRARAWVPAAWAASLLAALAGGFTLGHGAAPDATGMESARDLITVVREHGRELLRTGARAIHEYRPFESAEQGRGWLGRWVGDANTHLVHLAASIPQHDTRLAGGGTMLVAGEEVPLLHYRCCDHDLYVVFVMPAALSHFEGVSRVLAERHGVECRRCPVSNVALRLCPKSGAVIAAVGNGCAPGLAGAIAEP